ncbi:metallopeptidase family protein [Compostimonas suwonensis]|uniref:Zinicin-like metallopeptidase n=1 Tax=Compostimonas suwonensis TaxID=1048394 RepID=A0A2M9BUS7_9MICO|nr:metallopeptidase family protein [Compostimonas suwonensis]PJJ61711.1 hypothetical protein CLV54_2661 [Compostimonas suwonensis]
MPRSRHSAFDEPPPRSGGRNRHGRGIRSSVTGPHLPPLRTRIDTFDVIVASTAEYLRSVLPTELTEVGFEVAASPVGPTPPTGVERWRVDRAANRIILYRLPIQRLSRLHRNDEVHKRMMIEGCVFRAVAELLGKDPWDLAPGDFGHF